MEHRGNVSPSTLRIELGEDHIAVHYLDGRVTTYRGPFQPVDGTIRTPPGKEVHVLVVDPDTTDGILVYLNDLKTHDDVLESTGVGRLLLESADRREVFPGVECQKDGYAIVVDADPTMVDGRVFVFAEDEFSEHAYEIK